jgi:phospholipase/carboxylesterase
MQLIHALYEPPGDGPHPTILTLHGRGANAMDLLGLAPYLADGRFFVLCPQGPVQMPIGPGAMGYGWYPPAPGAGLPPDVPAVMSARKQLLAFLDAAIERYPIDPSKLLVLGFSQGGVMAYTLALSDPERFAALLALSTWFPAELLDHMADASAAQHLPTWIQHGTRDDMVPVERARTSVETLRDRRLPLIYREYDMGHEINGQSIKELTHWLEEKILARMVTP